MPQLLNDTNSFTVEWFYRLISNRIRGGYLRAFSEYIKQIPIPSLQNEVKARTEGLVTAIIKSKNDDASALVRDMDAEIDCLVAHLFGLTEEEFRVILEELALPDPVQRVALDAYRGTERLFRT